MLQLNLNPTPSQTYQLRDEGLSIPYWYHLRVMHGMVKSPFDISTESSRAFVRSELHVNGYDLPQKVFAALIADFLQLSKKTKAALRVLDLCYMQPRYNQIVYSTTVNHLESITPRLTVDPSKLFPSSKTPETTFGLIMSPLQVNTQADPRTYLSTYEKEDREAACVDFDAQEYESLDLCATLTPITELDYKDFLNAYPDPPAPHLMAVHLDADSENNIDLAIRAPGYGIHHVDALTNMQLNGLHNLIGVFRLVTSLNFTEDFDVETLLFGSRELKQTDEISSVDSIARAYLDSVADKAASATKSVQGKLNASSELQKFSRWSAERLSFEQLGSGSDSNAFAGSTSNKPDNQNVLRKALPATTVATNSSTSASRFEPTTENLLHLHNAGHTLAEIKEICGFTASVEQLQVKWYKAVAKGDSYKSTSLWNKV